MKSRKVIALLSTSLTCMAATGALLVPGLAHAQSTTLDNEQPENDPDSEIVVTGTLIRGIAPAGTNVIGVSEKAVEASGASSTAQLLQTIPQLGIFNNLQQPAGAFNNVTTNRPNLRNLPGFQTSGSSTTLVLVDGHRIVGMGVQSTSPDPDIVPPGIIERVEIVPDGGSAIYGSDAVAGVLNFITKKDFDGVAVDARYGLGSDYHTFDANATVGKKWDTGSAYISYNYSEHGDIYGRDRDYVRMYPKTLAGVPFPVTSIRCSPGNVQLVPSNVIYKLPYTTGTGTAVANTANQCDESDNYVVYPKEHRHSLFLGLNQDLTDTIKLDVRGYYMNRKVSSFLGENVDTQYVGPSSIFGFPTGLTDSPFRMQHLTGANPFEIHQINYAFGGPEAQAQRLSLKTWGVAPTLTADIGGGWQFRALGSYGRSTTENHTGQLNTTAIPAAIAAGLFNPYDPASSDPRGLAAASDFETFGRTRQQLFNTRALLDGSLFTLPGGDIKIALGAEYSHETIWSQKGTIVPGTENTGYAGMTVNGNVILAASAALPVVKLSRNVKSVFGEAIIPIVGPDNGGAGMEQLTLSVSGRYDDYSDFGDTFNPKLGLTYRPIDGVKLRASWGKSFVAPSLADDYRTDITSYNQVSGLSFLLPPANLVANGTYPNPNGNSNIVVVLGSAPGIQPQKARTWSVGMDLQPAFAPGLTMSLTYWNLDFKGVISVPSFTSQVDFWTNFGSVIYTNPSQALLDSFKVGANMVGGACAPQPTCVYALLDARKRNFARIKLDGLDFSTNYVRDTGFGSVDLSINANYELNRNQQATAASAFFNLLDANNSRFKASTTLGAQIGGLRAQATWNHSHGYKLNPSVGVGTVQTRVSSYNVFNLFFKYDVPAEGLFKDLSFTLGVNNVFNQDPPVYRQQTILIPSNGYINGNTVGRLVQFGASKKF